MPVSIYQHVDPLSAEEGPERHLHTLGETLSDPLRDPLTDADDEAVQAKGDAKAVKSIAAQGTAGSAGSLPYQAQIQKSFGRHDIGSVKAYTDDKAKAAAGAMGANAYAKGDKVVFGEGGMSLFVAAHEATHIIQQRMGVKPPGGVGSPGDPLEQQADEVADEVVQGNSAEPILDKIGR